MITLTANESRVLGVLVEKAQTTPQQYPLTLNALVNGANQKNNRDPVTNLSEEQVLESLDSLRNKGLVREAMLTGSRVTKYRHVAREVLEVDTNQLVILAELLLRGPQTIGELRGRASRMHPLESTEIVKNVLDSLLTRQPPLAKELPPAPGDRAPRYMQLLCPTLHPIDAPARSTWTPTRDIITESQPGEARLEARIEDLEREVKRLREVVDQITQALGVEAATSPSR